MTPQRHLTPAQRAMYGVTLLVVVWRVFVMAGWIGPIIVLVAGAFLSLWVWWSRRQAVGRA